MPQQRFEPGAVLRVDFDPPRHSYARMLSDHPYLAFYAGVHEQPVAPEQAVTEPVLFVLAVHDRAYQTGRWPRVGAVPLADAGVKIPEYFMQDMFNPAKCRIIDHLGNVRPARPEDCVGLERAAVWDAEHIEERLRDHHAGRPNPHLEHLRLKR